MKAYVACVGCEQRQLDAQRVMDYMRKNNVELVGSPASSDYAIVITCAVDSSTEKASLSRLSTVQSELPAGGRLIVGGCLPSISPHELSKYDVHYAFSPKTMDDLDGIFNPLVPMSSVRIPNRSVFDSGRDSNDGSRGMRAEYDRAKNGFKVVIDQGCLGSCSYCAIRNATGKLASRPLDDILSDVRQGILQGEESIMIMGGDTGAYGRDIGTRFPDLLGRMLSLPHRLYVHDFGVNWLIKDIVDHQEVFRRNEISPKMRIANFPIQSGSDRLLRLMRRSYSSGEARSALEAVKSLNPSIGMGTHIIVGFPTETDHDFDSTLSLLECVGFDFITCFPYSDHPLAESSHIPDKVAPDVVERRLRKLSGEFDDKVKVVR